MTFCAWAAALALVGSKRTISSSVWSRNRITCPPISCISHSPLASRAISHHLLLTEPQEPGSEVWVCAEGLDRLNERIEPVPVVHKPVHAGSECFQVFD